jgi:endonuclease/exonuclease/phosphatase family metal-dependent hydrolase
MGKPAERSERKSEQKSGDASGDNRSGEPEEVGAGRGTRLRCVTLNLWGENGPHVERLELVIAELRRLGPDVVAFQEVREAPGRLRNQAETVARALSFDVGFGPATEWGGGWEGVAILSRFGVRQSVTRALPHATKAEGRVLFSVELSGPAGALWVHTTHLSYRQDEGKEREDQLLFIDGELAARRQPPAVKGSPQILESPQLLLGDLNATPESDEIRWLSGLTTLGGRRVFYQDAWAAARPGESGYTWRTENPFRARMSWLPANRRIDYIFVTPARRDGRGTVRGAALAFTEPGARGIHASDHAGVVADVQIVGAEPPGPGDRTDAQPGPGATSAPPAPGPSPAGGPAATGGEPAP